METMTAEELMDLLQIRKTVFHELKRLGKLPPSIRVSPRREIWLRDTVHQWLIEQQAKHS